MGLRANEGFLGAPLAAIKVTPQADESLVGGNQAPLVLPVTLVTSQVPAGVAGVLKMYPCFSFLVGD